MIAIAQHQQAPSLHQNNQEVFLEMLPRIRSRAGRAFNWLGAELRDDLIQEVIANAFCAFMSLARRGKSDIAYATPLANYAVRQVLAGRRVGGSLNINDVTSPYAQAACRLVVGRLDEYDSDAGVWREALVEDRRATPADTAAARLDVAEWLLSLSARQRRIAETLAMGETASEAARTFRISTARISQLRVQLRRSWEQFQAGARGC